MKQRLFLFLLGFSLAGCTMPAVNNVGSTADNGTSSPKTTPTAGPLGAPADFLPDDAVKYLDALPHAEYELKEAILPDGETFGQFIDKLAKEQQQAQPDITIDLNDPPELQIKKLITKMLIAGEFLVTDTNHVIPDEGPNKPAQPNGLAYNYGSRDITARKKLYGSACTDQVFGLDCSGFLFQIFNRSNLKGNYDTLTAAQQIDPGT